jgi:hypothetical protein
VNRWISKASQQIALEKANMAERDNDYNDITQLEAKLSEIIHIPRR